MITVEEAKSILAGNATPLKKTVLKDIRHSTEFFLAQDIISEIDLPPFDQSNVDGFAVAMPVYGRWKIKAEIRAGDNPKFTLAKGEAARIFTGAKVPLGTFCILMQEKVEVRKDILIADHETVRGEFIRHQGSHVRKGSTVLRSGACITPAAAGLISSLGICKVKVYKKPVVRIIVTGDEITQPGKRLRAGKVFDSNSVMLYALTETSGLRPTEPIFVRDNRNDLVRVISNLLKSSDIILISGGVSVGKYDFVCEALNRLGAKELFYKVSQRPGKPLYFGKKDNVYVFGLPGNPASVMTCYYEYVNPLIRALRGFERIFPKKVFLPLLRDVNKNFPLSFFMRAKMSGDGVMPLDAQASYMLKSFAEADSLIYLPPEKTYAGKGETVEVHVPD